MVLAWSGPDYADPIVTWQRGDHRERGKTVSLAFQPIPQSIGGELSWGCQFLIRLYSQLQLSNPPREERDVEF